VRVSGEMENAKWIVTIHGLDDVRITPAGITSSTAPKILRDGTRVTVSREDSHMGRAAAAEVPPGGFVVWEAAARGWPASLAVTYCGDVDIADDVLAPRTRLSIGCDGASVISVGRCTLAILAVHADDTSSFRGRGVVAAEADLTVLGSASVVGVHIQSAGDVYVYGPGTVDVTAAAGARIRTYCLDPRGRANVAHGRPCPTTGDTP
jgi:hypothetical protein